MNKNMNLPAEYAVLSEEEMTYTQGGSDIGGFATDRKSTRLNSSH